MESVVKEISKKEGFLKSLESEKATVASDLLSAQGHKELLNHNFPTTALEDWKYTRTSRINKLQFNIEEEVQPFQNQAIPDLDCVRLVFVNGVYDDKQSSKITEQAGVVLSTLRQAVNAGQPAVQSHLGSLSIGKSDFFNAINASYNQDGLFLHVSKNVKSDKPIEVVFVSAANQTISNPRNLILLEEGAEAHVILRIESQDCDESLVNGVSECFVASNASLQIDKLQLDSERTFQIFTEEIAQEKDSRFAIRTFIHTADWVRNNLNIQLNGINAETSLSGAYILEGKQHVDNHTVVDHKVPHCVSRELYKGLIDDNSTAVFNGKVFVREDAQKTEAYQSNANILLSDDATINSKPELEIYADDVKCSHGSTTGQFDGDAVFYLKSRGLDTRSAYKLLTTAFIGEVVQEVNSIPLKTYITRKMNLGAVYLDLE